MRPSIFCAWPRRAGKAKTERQREKYGPQVQNIIASADTSTTCIVRQRKKPQAIPKPLARSAPRYDIGRDQDRERRADVISQVFENRRVQTKLRARTRRYFLFSTVHKVCDPPQATTNSSPVKPFRQEIRPEGRSDARPDERLDRWARSVRVLGRGECVVGGRRPG